MVPLILNETIPNTIKCAPTIFSIKTYIIICPIAVILSILIVMGLKVQIRLFNYEDKLNG